MAKDDEYTCTLRIDGQDLDPLDVEAAMGIRGNAQHIVRRALAGMPALDFRRWEFPPEDAEGSAYWPRLEDALEHIAASLLPAQGPLSAYGAKGQAFWWCGCFHENPPSVVHLGRDLVNTLAILGVPVYLENYFPSDESDIVPVAPPEDGTADVSIEHAHVYRFGYTASSHLPDHFMSAAWWDKTAPWSDFSSGLEDALARHARETSKPQVLVCDHQQFAFSGGPRLTAAHLRWMAALDLSLVIVWRA